MTTPRAIGINYTAGTSANPARVPDPATVDRRWVWYSGHPSTIHQRGSIQRRLHRIGISEADLAGLMGDGYRDVRSLSKWAASWLITELNAYLNQPHSDAAVKAGMARILREKHPHLPGNFEGESA